MNLEEYRRLSLEGWNTIAPEWEADLERMWRDSHHVVEWLVDRLEPNPGQTILELASGPGTVGFLAAPRLGPTGRLIATDFSPAMAEIAAKRADQLGLSNVEVRVMDAERMDLASDSVDGVLCRWGYMLMADPKAALAETRRVLRPGGRLSFAVWGPPERNAWGVVVNSLLVERGLVPAPEPGAPGLFALSDEAVLRSVLEGAGFTPRDIEAVPLRWMYRAFDEYWDVLTRGSMVLRRAMEPLSEEERDGLREAVREVTSRFRVDVGLELPAETLCVLAE